MVSRNLRITIAEIMNKHVKFFKMLPVINSKATSTQFITFETECETFSLIVMNLSSFINIFCCFIELENKVLVLLHFKIIPPHK